MTVSPGGSLISYSYLKILVTSGLWADIWHFDFLWAWFIILRHLRHHKKCAWATSQNRVNNSNQFRRYRDLQLMDPARFTQHKSGRCSRVNSCTNTSALLPVSSNEIAHEILFISLTIHSNGQTMHNIAPLALKSLEVANRPIWSTPTAQNSGFRPAFTK